MTSRFMLIFAAISGFIFVALGAFGAHVLSKTMDRPRIPGVSYAGDLRSGGGNAASHQYLVLLE